MYFVSRILSHVLLYYVNVVFEAWNWCDMYHDILLETMQWS